MSEDKFGKAFDERELAPGLENVTEKADTDLDVVGKLLEDIKNLEVRIQTGDLRGKSVDDLNGEKNKKAQEVERLEKEGGFTVIEEK